MYGLPTIQENLDIKISCSAIPEAVIIKAEVTEALSELFSIDVFLQTTRQINIDSVVNSPASISMKWDQTHYFSGFVELASFENVTDVAGKKTDSILYIRIVPTLARTAYFRKYRAFQEQSAKDIIQSVLKENGVSNLNVNLQSAGSDKRAFCVQYGENDFHFISRLMEEEGIFYYFEHKDGEDWLHISDNNASAHKIATALEIKKALPADVTFLDSVFNITLSSSIGTKKVDSFAYNDAKAEVVSGASSASSSASNTRIGEKEFFNNQFAEKAAGDRYSRTILESNNSTIKKLTGNGHCPSVRPGAIFQISGSHTDAHNGEFFVTHVKHTITQLASGGEAGVPVYQNSFVAIPKGVVFKPQHTHFKHRIFGCQTAVVTGTSGEEIFCDEDAKIKVKFHWDSRTKQDEKSSCWIRIAQSWAGNKFGTLIIPRVGMEVLVEFVDGDPDQPIVTGCIYNGVNKPPSNYAKEKNTVSSFYTNSSKGGKGFNELRFNDKTDEEEVFVHAQKDLNLVTENCVSEIITDGSKSIILESKKDPTKHSLLIKKGNNTVTLNDGDYTIILDKGNQSITLKDGNQTVKLSNGDLNVDVTGSVSIKASKDITISSDGAVNIKSMKATTITSQDSIEQKAVKDCNISCMNSKTDAKMNLEMSGLNAKFTAKMNCELSGLMIKATAQAMCDIMGTAATSVKSGGALQLTGTAGVALQGASIKLN
ncbi:MAG: type VI secretion system tip protein VgrG [Holosporales bacterium]|jgi:type VI secretion system secreted protein VgrG|nr:type VI secretion system tip protein VgrG [Holosporales bacterium]